MDPDLKPTTSDSVLLPGGVLFKKEVGLGTVVTVAVLVLGFISNRIKRAKEEIERRQSEKDRNERIDKWTTKVDDTLDKLVDRTNSIDGRVQVLESKR